MTVKRLFWASFIAALLVYIAIVGWSLPRISAEAGGLRPFDVRPMGYDQVEARAFLEALSDTGRDFYLGAQAWLDLVYPALSFLTLAAGAVWLLWGQALVPLVIVLLAALAGMGFDYVENARVADMLRAAPGAVTAEQVAAASRATVLKSVCTTIAMTGLLIAAGWRGFRAWRTRS